MDFFEANKLLTAWDDGSVTWTPSAEGQLAAFIVDIAGDLGVDFKEESDG